MSWSFTTYSLLHFVKAKYGFQFRNMSEWNERNLGIPPKYFYFESKSVSHGNREFYPVFNMKNYVTRFCLYLMLWTVCVFFFLIIEKMSARNQLFVKAFQYPDFSVCNSGPERLYFLLVRTICQLIRMPYDRIYFQIRY